MSGLNRAMIIGHLGKDPEVKYLTGGGAVASFSVATSESWKDKNTGDKREHTEWHNIVIYGRLAEIAGEYLRKGSKVFVEGKLRTRKWEDRKKDVDRYTTEIICSSFQMLDRRTDGEGGGRSERSERSNSRQESRQQDDFDDDIPF